MKDQNKNEKSLPKVLNNLTPEAIYTIKGWWDPDLEILKKYLDFLSELVCDLTIQMDNNEDHSKLLKQTILLSHLFEDMKTFEIEKEISDKD